MNRSVKDIYWLAGLLEGEGSFGILSNGSNPVIYLQMNDYDIVFKVRSLMCKHYAIGIRSRQPNDSYVYRVHGNIAIQWMMTLYPLMGKRRKEKITEILNLWKNHRGNKYYEYGDRCRQGHLITKLNSRDTPGGGLRCRLCTLIYKDSPNSAVRRMLIAHLKEEEAKLVSHLESNQTSIN
jgi:hypothetical protein